MDLNEVEYRIENLRMLGSKGTTGTQASFMELFDGDESKVKELEKRIADDFGFAGVVPVSGQTYSRKIDADARNASPVSQNPLPSSQPTCVCCST